MIPAGGMKLPSSPKTGKLKEAADGNIRSLDSLVMDGSAVFNFVQTHVPPMINSLLEESNSNINDIDYFAFHQPNKFMLEKLAQKMNIDTDKMPNNLVELYGNSSGVTIPALIALNFEDKLLNNDFCFCLAGFGVGLTWASAIMQIGHMNFIKTIEYEGVKMDILEKLSEILELEEVHAEDNLDEFELWDSLTILSIISMLDEDYSVNIDGDKLAEFKTVQEIVDLIK